MQFQHARRQPDLYAYSENPIPTDYETEGVVFKGFAQTEQVET